MDGQGKRVFFFLFSEISHDLPGVATHCLPSCRTQKTIMEQCQDLPVKAERNKMLSEVNSTFSKKKKKTRGNTMGSFMEKVKVLESAVNGEENSDDSKEGSDCCL